MLALYGKVQLFFLLWETPLPIGNANLFKATKFDLHKPKIYLFVFYIFVFKDVFFYICFKINVWKTQGKKQTSFLLINSAYYNVEIITRNINICNSKILAVKNTKNESANKVIIIFISGMFVTCAAIKNNFLICRKSTNKKKHFW